MGTFGTETAALACGHSGASGFKAVWLCARGGGLNSSWRLNSLCNFTGFRLVREMMASKRDDVRLARELARLKRLEIFEALEEVFTSAQLTESSGFTSEST